MNETLTGKVAPEGVHDRGPDIEPEILKRYLAVFDLSGTVSDALDEYGIETVIGSSTLRPTITDARIVGQATTVRNVPVPRQAYLNTNTRQNKLGEMEGHNQARPGDVLVVQGARNISSMGGVSATQGQKQGEVGAIIDGGIRDVGWQRKIGYPIWSRDITPVTGKWRARTVEINGQVNIAGCLVNPGDLVIADETGICFVPFDMIVPVLERVEEIEAGEAHKHRDIEAGMSIPEVAHKSYKYMDTYRSAL
jgi:4-hydroxy-4-methyl-2-oxoglutarate aldolase